MKCPNDKPIFITSTSEREASYCENEVALYNRKIRNIEATALQHTCHIEMKEGHCLADQDAILNPQIEGTDKRDVPNQTEEHLQRVQNMLTSYQQRRLMVCEDLEEYLASLATKKDDLGETLIHFPGNFDRIVSLMNEADISDGKDTHTQSKSNQGASWSHLLIERALNKHYATDENNRGEMTLETKIAVKTARIRQLDAILEFKWGKNLYNEVHKATVDVHKKDKITEIDPTPNHDNKPRGKQRTSKRRVTFRLDGTKKVNYIERNRDLIRNGSTKFTRDEEERLDHLLSEDPVAEKLNCPQSTDINAFALEREEKDAIEQLIHDRAGIYQPILLDEDSIITIPDESHDDDREASLSHLTQNVIQNNKKERLTQQRLEQINQDLQLLKDLEHTGIVIASDDEDDNEPASQDRSQVAQHHRADDDMSSLRSFRTTSHASVASSCRSVLSRREFHEFIRAQIDDASAISDAIASREDVSNLLRIQGYSNGPVP
ncbi:unnamed protein product [Albugo candida]|nr:unnamed protein product [Albugo candida]|eukprot:CCI40486.1 unnamed protein product [Albugo candida]